MKHIGIISALPAEIRFILNNKIPLNQPVRINDYITLYVCGMGPEHAYRAADQLLKLEVHGLISWGTAGALSDELTSGDMILPEIIITESETSYLTDYAWRAHIYKLLEKLSIKSHQGIHLSTNEVLTIPEDKVKRREKTGAIAVDMESAAIARSAMSKSIPFIVIKAIIDESTMIIPQSISENIDEFGKVMYGAFLKSVFTSPGDLVFIKDLYLANRKANKSLSRIGKHIDKILL